jgi:hypothetical protein
MTMIKSQLKGTQVLEISLLKFHFFIRSSYKLDTRIKKLSEFENWPTSGLKSGLSCRF